jgi:hypothetical protein
LQSCEDVTLESTNTSVLLGIGREEINMAIYGFLSAQTWKLFKRKQNCQITHFFVTRSLSFIAFYSLFADYIIVGVCCSTRRIFPLTGHIPARGRL